MKRVVSLITSLIFLGTLAGFAQTPTGTLQGTVIDPSGAAVPGATVRVTSTSTNETKNLMTDVSGHYILPFVNPGTYDVVVEATGFRAERQSAVKIDISQNRSIDFTLVVGGASQEVEVVATATTLDTNTSVMGALIDHKKVLDLPLNGRNPFDLAALVPGVSTIGGASTPHIGGSRNGNNEQQIDGVSNITPENNVGNNGTAYQPLVDSVQEFSVQINSLSAEYGRFAGGVINVVTKSGSNELHGSGFEFARNAVLDANDFFANRNGASIPDMHKNQYGGTVGGPIVIPRLYNGHNKSFFFFGFEGSREASLATETNSVPIDAFRKGDFSSLGATIYDPLTAKVQPDGSITRTAFPGNIIPASRFDAVGAKLMSYYPEPNAGAPGALNNNLFTSGSNTDNSKHWDTRLDHSFSEQWKMFLRFSHSTDVNNPFSDYNSVASQGWGGPSTGGAWSASMDHTITLSPTLLLDLRYGLSRSNVLRNTYSKGFDLTSLGLPQSVAAAASQRVEEFPRVDISNGYSGLGPNGWVDLIENPLVHDFTASTTKIFSKHTVKFGGEYRKLFLNFTQYGHPSGDYSFDTGWTQQIVNNYNGSGSPFASLLLGLPNSGQFTHEPTAADASSYMAWYIQDDYKLTSRFTLNIGLRWDVDFPRTERYNQLSLWNPSLPSPLQGKVPASACLACGNLMGQMQYVGLNGAPYGRSQGPTQWKDFAPRVGFAWNVADKTVIRSGFGIAYAPSALQAAGTSGAPGIEGFNTNSNMLTSIDGQKTVNTYLSNPFPAGFNLPRDSATGPSADIGTSISDSYFPTYRNPYSIQWNFNVQRQIPLGMTLEIGYLGNRGLFLVDGDPGLTFDQVNPAYLSMGQQLLNYVANPFYGLINLPGGSSLDNPTIQSSQLLRPYPQYTNVQGYRKPTANSIYHGVTMRLEKRFSSGLTYLVSFTGGKTMDNSASAVGYLGPTGGTSEDAYNRRLDWAVSPQDVSKNLVTSFAYELPFGKGKKLLTGAPKLANLLISGWQANGILQFASGTPLIIGGASNNLQAALFTPSGQRPDISGDANISNPTIAKWFNTAVFSNPAPFTFGTAPRTLPNARNPGVENTDLSLFKNNYIGSEGRYNLQFRVEAFNALNHAQFAGPDVGINDGSFGVISSTAHSPRQVQLAIKFYF